MSLLDRFKKHLADSALIQRGSRVLVAVSGGIDSVVLLHLLHLIKDAFSFTLNVVHVHHGIRGAEADQDVRFVHDLAERYGCGFFHEKVDAPELAAQRKLSLEEAARTLRYCAFEKILKASKSDICVTAHTADDQAETILDHFLRGSGVSGLRGIPEVRGSFVRPLLPFQRAEIERFAREHQLEYREDLTNRDQRFRRNRIRHHLIPELMQYNPNLLAVLSRTGRIFSETESFLNFLAEDALNSLVSLHKKNEIILEIDPFLSYFNILKKYILMRACERISIQRRYLTFDKLERALNLIQSRKLGKKLAIAPFFELSIDHDGIVLKKKEGRPKAVTLDLLNQQTCQFHGYILKWGIFQNTGSLQFEDSRKVELVSLDKVGTRLNLRTALPGDRFIPLNFKGQKKVADYFSDLKVPRHIRETIPILECPDGIVWICGYAIDDRFKVTESTKQVLRLELHGPIDG